MKISLHWLNTLLDRPVDADEAERLLTDLGFPIETRESVAAAPGDVMLDVEVTSNRGDVLSHVGVAREVAAASGRRVVMPKLDQNAGGGAKIETLTSIANERTDLCPLYIARVIRGVKIGPSPAWLARRLEAVGLRPINNVVDVTNHVLMEFGQPLHAFDMSRLAERRIVVRAAKPGEPFTAIDGSKHALKDHMLVIADAARPMAVAGVMGGLDSEVTLATTDVLLESARFDPASIRRTSRTLKLASDSSHRFERGVDPLGVELASRRAVQLILETAGGELAAGSIRVGVDDPQPRVVTLRVSRCNALLGLELPTQRVVELLGNLGLSPSPSESSSVRERVAASSPPGEGAHAKPAESVAQSGRTSPHPGPLPKGEGASIMCLIPPFRHDLEREVDLIEEVGRLHGLNHVQIKDRILIHAKPRQPKVAARQKVADVLVAHGYHETITFSLLALKHGQPFVAAGAEGAQVEDERRKGEPMLRPSLLPSLLLCRKTNQDLGNGGVRLFEAASVWSKVGGRIVEGRRLSLIADAAGNGAGQLGEALRDLRGTIEELTGQSFAPAAFEPGDHAAYSASAAVTAGGKPLGVMGLLAPSLLKVFELHTPVVAAELDLAILVSAYPPARAVRELARFPGIERDLSVVVDEAVAWSRIEQESRGAKPALLEDLRFVVTYRGKPIPAGKKSVSFRMTFRDPQATLRHDQVDPQVASVVEKLKRELGAELRT